MNGLEIKEIRKKEGLSQTDFGKKFDVSLRTVQNWESSSSVSKKIELLIKSKYVNTAHIEEATIPNTEIIPNKNGNEFIDLGGGLKLMKVPLLEIKTQAGFADNFQDTEFLTGIEDFHSVIVKEVHRGKYIAFRVIGNSMDDDTGEAIRPNSIVTCRELQRHHWKDKLRINKFPYWVIATKESKYPPLKQIISHDVEKGIIKCHSLNDGPEYKDFELHLNDITALFYVIDVSRTISDTIY